MHGTDKAGIVGTNKVPDFDRVIQIRDLKADEAFFPMAAPAARVSW